MRSLLNSRVFPLIVVFLILAPHMMRGQTKRGQTNVYNGTIFGLPRIISGDEPVYLLMINSIINDYDMDLKNNKESVYEGSQQMGKVFAGEPIVNHAVWFINGKRYQHDDVYELDVSKWETAPEGKIVPMLLDTAPDVSELPEYSTHPYGIAFISAPFLFPFRNTEYVEPAALLMSALVTIIAVFLFRSLLRLFSSNNLAINVITTLAFLGTPLWHYGRTMFNESWLAMFTVAAVYFALKGRRSHKAYYQILAGFSVALGMLMKPVFLIVAVPVIILFLFRKELKYTLVISIFPMVSILIVLYLNYIISGSVFRGPQDFEIGNLFKGVVGLLFSLKAGLFLYAPITIIGLLLFPGFIKKYGMEALVIGTVFVVYFLLMALWTCWWGGHCYGPRLIVPVIPLLLVSLVQFKQSILYKKHMLYYATISIGCTSLMINLIAAMLSWRMFSMHPFIGVYNQFVKGFHL